MTFFISSMMCTSKLFSSTVKDNNLTLLTTKSCVDTCFDCVISVCLYFTFLIKTQVK